MSLHGNDDLDRAKAAVTIFQLWDAAGLPGVAPSKDGMVNSPFRSEKTPSFSISKHGKVWADFGGESIGGKAPKGGVWEFAARCPCWSTLDDAGIAKVLIQVSGIIPTPRPSPASSSSSAAGQAAPVVDERLVRAAKAIERKDKARAAENAVYEERAALLEVPKAKPAPIWPACVKKHYLEGVDELRSDKRRRTVAELASDRGWPEEWAAALIEQDLVSFPWERWANPADRWAKRQKAFAVLAPRFTAAGVTTLEPIGYHQRFYVPPRGEEPARKGWLYVPSLPKVAPQSAFERELVDYAGKLGVTIEERAALVAPLPFVLGDVQAPRLAVLLEGQWDATTFFGACGWFHDTTPPQGVVVFGIRGAKGIDAFLAHWAPWLERVKPRFWVIADNDAAGGDWRDAPSAEPGLPRPPSLAEKLEFVTDRHGRTRGTTIVSWLKRGPFGKDFNDYFKAAAAAGRPLTPDKMWRWMAAIGLLDASGGWK